MDRGSKLLQLKIWTINHTVINKKALMYAGMRPVDFTKDPETAIAATVSSVVKPQNFHKKSDSNL